MPNPSKNSSKCQQRHEEHNYTNPALNEATAPKLETTSDAVSSNSGDNQRTKNSPGKAGNAFQLKNEANSRQGVQVSQTNN